MKTVKIFLVLAFVSAAFISCSSDDEGCYDLGIDSEVHTSTDASGNKSLND
ncbi:hypothetical protein [Flagellimonas allohymeniacidonis]|uniref:hypothetical protein n=1 Tax=Flagellimonas allohymeniacidonis TaxID=2517819 RepID=UPI0013EED924|nr:hypothetical protein [Allomuricauda hymeniacidonis]